MSTDYSSSSIARLRVLSVALLVAVATPLIALAMPIQFDPDGAAPGNGVLTVSTVDFLPGNTLVTGIGALTTNKSAVPVSVYAQTRIGALLDPGSQQLTVNGLNTTFELTLVLGFSALASVDNTISGTHPLPTASFTLDANPTLNFCQLYYDSTPDANDLLGTGFADGQLILDGDFTAAGGGFFRFADTPLFDGFGPDNYGGLLTRHVAGGGDYRVGVSTVDTSFFVGGLSQVMIELLNDSTVTPFGQVNPAQQFYGPGAVNPNLGALNGNGPDFQSQSDANASFTPEPSSFVLGGVGAMGMLAGLRRRKKA